MTDQQRLIWGAAMILAVIAFGTLGYMVIEGLVFIDALYLVVITVSTVGFAEPGDGFSYAGEAFTIIIVVLGVGGVFYTAATTVEWLVDELVGGRRQQRRELRMIASLEDHVVVCGFGRVGRSVATRLQAGNTPLVVVDSDEERVERARVLGYPVVQGDATHEDVLTIAGLDRAATLIACVRADAENLSIVLSARAAHIGLFILARASEASAERRLRLAGADRVITPPEVGAERLAAIAMHPMLTEFVDIAADGALVEFQVEELGVTTESELVGKTLAGARIRSVVGSTILAVRHTNGMVTTNPSPTAVIEPGDVLVAIGTVDQLRALRQLV